MKVYAKNSFDRFGDDLTEEILQYLTFEDKIRLECVSKQWKRCVFEKQFVIELRHKRIEKQNSLDKLCYINNNLSYVTKVMSLESVLKKCSNITKVKLGNKVDNSVLSLIGRYCPRIKSLTYVYSNGIKDYDFLRIYGYKLEELYLYSKNELTVQYLRHCPNLKTLFVEDLLFRFPKHMEFLPNLERIKSNISTYSIWNYPKDVKIIEYLTDNNNNNNNNLYYKNMSYNLNSLLIKNINIPKLFSFLNIIGKSLNILQQ